MANSRDQLQQALASRGPGGAAAKATAATAPVASFSDWMFYGQGGSVFVSVTISPTQNNYSISYALVLLQTPSGIIVCDGAVAPNVAQGGFTLNLATGSDTYNLGQYGSSIQAYAFAQVYGVGEVWSPVQNYTVQP